MTAALQLPVQSHREPPALLGGADAAVNAVIGRWRRRASNVRDLRRQAALIEAQSPVWETMTDVALAQGLRSLGDKFCRRRGDVDEETLLKTAAALREAAHRRLGLRAYPVQLMGALALRSGSLVEMVTGEGKTLTAGLAAAMAGFTRLPCHVITVNDYLAGRDVKRLRPLYEFCGLTVGHVPAAMPAEERRAAYRCHVTYVTGKEVLADFLRDRMITRDLAHPSRRLVRQLLSPKNTLESRLVLERGIHSAIVDEADSVLIDEAVTPLIISQARPNQALQETVESASLIARAFERDRDYTVNQEYREIELTPSGEVLLAGLVKQKDGLWSGSTRRWEWLRTALLAREFYHCGKQYVIHQEKVVIVDEFTGRAMAQRSWRQGLHQAVEAKEGLPITAPSETVARMSFQRFFRGYRHLAGMTGTAAEAAGEFWQIYQLPVLRVPTNRPCVREHWPMRFFGTEEEKWFAIVESIRQVHAQGRPLLVGTRNVAASERLAKALQEIGLTCEVLNATRMEHEAFIIMHAGERGRITIATNMAGRGTDIQLGKGVADLGGLHVIATEAHEAPRIDRQLFGRAGRQGDPGSAQLFVSQEDDLVQRFLGNRERRYLGKRLLRKAQRRAQKRAYQQRRGVLKSDDWLDSALSFSG